MIRLWQKLFGETPSDTPNLAELKKRLEADQEFARVTVLRRGKNLKRWLPLLSRAERRGALSFARLLLRESEKTNRARSQFTAAQPKTTNAADIRLAAVLDIAASAIEKNDLWVALWFLAVALTTDRRCASAREAISKVLPGACAAFHDLAKSIASRAESQKGASTFTQDQRRQLTANLITIQYLTFVTQLSSESFLSRAADNKLEFSVSEMRQLAQFAAAIGASGLFGQTSDFSWHSTCPSGEDAALADAIKRIPQLADRFLYANVEPEWSLVCADISRLLAGLPEQKKLQAQCARVANMRMGTNEFVVLRQQVFSSLLLSVAEMMWYRYSTMRPEPG